MPHIVFYTYMLATLNPTSVYLALVFVFKWTICEHFLESGSLIPPTSDNYYGNALA